MWVEQLFCKLHLNCYQTHTLSSRKCTLQPKDIPKYFQCSKIITNLSLLFLVTLGDFANLLKQKLSFPCKNRIFCALNAILQLLSYIGWFTKHFETKIVYFLVKTSIECYSTVVQLHWAILQPLLKHKLSFPCINKLFCALNAIQLYWVILQAFWNKNCHFLFLFKMLAKSPNVTEYMNMLQTKLFYIGGVQLE